MQQTIIRLSGILLVLVVFMSCSRKDKNSYSLIKDDPENLAMAIAVNHPGKELMESHCYICHEVNSSRDERIAPPMMAVKRHYLTQDISKKEFIENIVAWCENPTEENSKMRGAVNKFGVMPHMYYPQEIIEQIADYMFDHEIEMPGQGKGRQMGQKRMQNKNMNENETMYSQQLPNEERAMKMAQTSQAELGKNLMAQIEKNGVPGALEFCNIEAIPITDSMSTIHNVQLKRVSDKARNPNNQADAVELQHIATFKNQLAKDEEIQPILTKTGDQIEFYTPIITNGMCLLCHGAPGKELEYSNLSEIRILYPDDKAIGYEANEVRGIWSIKFEE